MHRTPFTATNERENRLRQNHDAEVDQQRFMTFVQTVGRPIATTRERYIDPAFLQRCRISLKPLSFTTGKLPVGVTQFLEPIQPSTIEKWLDDPKPWTIRKDWAYPDIKDEPFSSNGQIAAAYFWSTINIYLTCAVEGRSLLHQTNWRKYSNIIKTLNRLQKGYANWQVQDLLSYTLGPSQQDKEDQKTSQMICFLADEAQLREGMISTSELTTIVVLATKTAACPCYHFSHIPITVISGSGRHVRIVQGVFNTLNCSLDLRVSKIISFDKGIVANKQNFFTLLGWFLAKPIGNTGLDS